MQISCINVQIHCKTLFTRLCRVVKGHTWKFPQNSPQRFEGDLQIYLIAKLIKWWARGLLSPNCDYPNVCPDALGDATMITSLIFYWCNLGFGQAINYFYISQMYEPNAWCHNLGGPFFRQTRVSMKLSFCRRNSFSLILEHWIQSLALIVSCFYAKVESSPGVVFWRVTLSQASFRRGVNYPRISDTSP